MQNFFPGHLTLTLLIGPNLSILSQYHTSANLSLTVFTIDYLPIFKTIQFFVTVLIPANLISFHYHVISFSLFPSIYTSIFLLSFLSSYPLFTLPTHWFSLLE